MQSNRTAAYYALSVAAFLLMGWAWTPYLSRSPLEGDESHWIATSLQFEAFISGDWNSPVWDVQYWTLTQPPVTRYLIGLGRTLGGFGPETLNVPWEYALDYAGNERIGAIPSAGLLWWSRLPMLWLALVSGAVLIRLAAQAAGWPAGIGVALLLAGSRYLPAQLTHAMGESALLGFALLAIAALIAALRRWQRAAGMSDLLPQRPARALGWVAAAGVAVGLTTASKLNGGTVLLGCLAAWLLASLPRGSLRPHPLQARLALQGSLLLVGLAVATFVIVNPFVLHDPLRHSLMMYEQRTDEMKRQRLDWPEARIDDAREWLAVVPGRILQDYASLSFPGAAVVNLGLAGVGLARLALNARQFFAGTVRGRASRSLLLTALTLGSLPLLIPLDWSRYYLLPVVFVTLFVAVGAAEAGRVLWRLAERRGLHAQPARRLADSPLDPH